jgi:hypothetical protein
VLAAERAGGWCAQAVQRSMDRLVDTLTRAGCEAKKGAYLQARTLFAERRSLLLTPGAWIPPVPGTLHLCPAPSSVAVVSDSDIGWLIVERYNRRQVSEDAELRSRVSVHAHGFKIHRQRWAQSS